MAGPGRRRIEMPARLFRLAVRDLRAAAAAAEHQFADLGGPEEEMAPPAAAEHQFDDLGAPEEAMAPPAAAEHQFHNLGAPEEAMAPPATPGTFDFGLAVGETADTQEGAVVKSLESGKKQPVDSVRDGGETSTKRLADSVGAETETTKKRRFSVGVESETAKKRSCSSRLGADTFGLFKGKPTGDGEGIFSSGMELAAGTSTGHLKSFKKKHKGTEGLMEIGSPNLVKHITKSKDAHESVSPDATQKAKNDMATLDFLAEMQEKYSLDSYRQKFALTNGLPLPPPSWDRLCTPPIPSSPPPPIVEISNYKEGKNAIRAWSNGCNVHLQVSQQLSLANAEQISDLVKVAKAEQVIVNLSVLEAKVSQAQFIQKMIRHAKSDIQRFNKMLSLPWMPT